MDYPNFFESQKEAVIRLHGTVVLYGDEPVEILTTADHLGDGTIYAYIRPLGLTPAERENFPAQMYQHPSHPSGSLGKYMDSWIEKNPNGNIRRVPLSDYKFNRFRPYELGMYWAPPGVCYVERQPNRKTEQGLTVTMLVSKKLGLEENAKVSSSNIEMLGPEMKRCIQGEHPTAQRCIEGLTGDKYENNAAAFHRHFAFIRGPVDTMFLAYKDNTIGVLPHGDFSQVRLAKDFGYTKEAVDELNLFNDIRI